MAYLVEIGPWPSICPGWPSPGEWLAVRFLRRAVHATNCFTGIVNVGEASAQLARAEEEFCSFLAAARRGEGAREPRLAHPDSPLVTKDERRLLRALAAAQAGDEMLLDNYLYKLALAALPRAQLAQAMRALARALTAQKHRPPGKASRFMASLAAVESSIWLLGQDRLVLSCEQRAVALRAVPDDKLAPASQQFGAGDDRPLPAGGKTSRTPSNLGRVL